MKTKDILKRRGQIAAVFVLWGAIWYYVRSDSVYMGALFMVIGGILSLKNYHTIKKGDYKDVVVDERAEINSLKASKLGFAFMLLSIAILFIAYGLNLINEVLFVAFMGPVFAVASILYIWAYYKYEMMG